MGKKKKEEKKKDKKLMKAEKKKQKKLLKAMAPPGCKTKCCEKYLKSESKRCKRCPCFDLMAKVA
ncbi:hypothetical protein [Arenibacter latericius]|uniref:hypothetical protein n=1 Tax=Arenibacter latericius TaxID=86104 RepID=UPI0004262A9D|nr:hypothetical protein [Arenibacter latericius]MDX1363624.1 hypothetical protein [Arenibacter latericius]